MIYKMDSYATIGSTSGILALVSLISVGLYKLCYHSHCKSACCGRQVSDFYTNLGTPEAEGISTITT